ncbi:MAG: UvrD-helicase domain-containing protein [Micropruina glycogenica]
MTTTTPLSSTLRYHRARWCSRRPPAICATHAVAALAVRLLGEGDTTIDRLLMVTFGRNATRELRARVRHHLIEATMTAQPGLTRDRPEAAVGSTARGR